MAVDKAHVFPGFLTLVLTQLSFQNHQLFFSHASEVRGEISRVRHAHHLAIWAGLSNDRKKI